MTAAWKKVSGPGNVTFSDAASPPTRVKFSAVGIYEIELTATDGENSSTLKVSVTVS